MKQRSLVRAAFALAVPIGLAACGASTPTAAVHATAAATAADPTTTAPTTEPVEEADGWENAVELTTLLYANKYEEALPLVQPGSPAERYVQQQLNVEKAVQANGDIYDPPTATVEADDEARAVEIAAGDDSYTWRDFEYGEDGKVVTWTGAQGPIERVLAATQPSGSANGTSITVLSAYLSNSGNLFVVARIDASRDIAVPDFPPSYTDRNGLIYEAASVSLPDSIDKGTSALALFVFADSEFGGTLTYTAFDAEHRPTKIRLTIE